MPPGQVVGGQQAKVQVGQRVGVQEHMAGRQVVGGNKYQWGRHWRGKWQGRKHNGGGKHEERREGGAGREGKGGPLAPTTTFPATMVWE